MQMCPHCGKVYDESEDASCPRCHPDKDDGSERTVIVHQYDIGNNIDANNYLLALLIESENDLYMLRIAGDLLTGGDTFISTGKGYDFGLNLAYVVSVKAKLALMQNDIKKAGLLVGVASDALLEKANKHFY